MILISSIFIVALASALTATPLLKQIALRFHFVDQPSSRKVHLNPTPLMGGIAIYFAILLSIFLLHEDLLGEFVSILAGATILSFTGLIDDRKQLHSIIKMPIQALVAVGIYFSGIHVQLQWLPFWANFFVTVFWIVGITNAMNLLDNMDGLSAGISTIASAFFMLIAIHYQQSLVAALCAAIFGACLGFLFFNSHPAQIFMGDSGALLLGFLLSCIGIKLRFPNHTDFTTWMIPVVILTVPIFDTTLVTISRLRRRVNPLTASGKDHISHRLVAGGMTHRKAVFTIYAACIFCGLLGLAIIRSSVFQGYLIGSLDLLLFIILLWFFEKRHKPPS